MSLHIPATGEPIVVTPEVAGWAYCGLRILELSPGTPQILATGDSEAFVLPLAGAVTVFVAGAAGGIETSFELAGRDSVFAAVTDFAYVGRDSVITLTSARGAEVALPSARCTARRAAAYGAASDVRVEVRGAGPATR
ncbi:MAG: 5-deoxy-glucuronate isomerase, partial [Pseudonocardiales bacterium]|nr:5-deoxy-glucuronate isomerase [Pseudonocardiales bacterium]